MTRAMQQLYFTYAEQRRLHGMDNYGAPSRFIQEIPPAMIEEVRPRIRVSHAPLLGSRFSDAGRGRGWRLREPRRQRPAGHGPGRAGAPRQIRRGRDSQPRRQRRRMRACR